MKLSFTPLLISLIFACVVFTLPAHAALHPAQQLAEQTSQQLLTKLREERVVIRKSPGRIYELVSAILLPHFDFERMASSVLGKHWRTATPAQKTRFAEEFRTLLVRTYATSLTEYTERKITFLPLRADPATTDVVVHSQVDQPGAQPITIDYSLYLKEGAWKVYDVAIENISLLTNYRTSFGGEIRQKGLDALIETLANRNQQAKQ